MGLRRTSIIWALLIVALSGDIDAAEQDRGLSLPADDLPGLRDPVLDLGVPRIELPKFDGTGLPRGPLVGLLGFTPEQIAAAKRLQVQQTGDPDLIANAIEIQAERQSPGCQSSRCRSLSGVVARLRRAADRYPECGEAAREFAKVYEGIPSRQVASAFDLACLGSIEPRLVGGVSETGTDQPPIFSRGGSDPAAQGAISAVALLEFRGEPRCAGLLRNDRSFVTARHCLTNNAGSFTQGNVTVRPISGSGRGPWPIRVLPRSGSTGSSSAVRDDWVVFDILTTDPIKAADVDVVPFAAGPVTLIGHYVWWNHSAMASGAAAQDWRRALRFPRPGLCEAIEAEDGCIKLACETIRGFSGTPVFAESPAKTGEKLHLVGLISQPLRDGSMCSGLEINGITLAVAADRFQ